MFVENPFIVAADLTSARFMQIYVIAMIIAVAAGTLFDLYHKRSAEFFTTRRRQTKAAATRRLSNGDLATIAVKTLAHDVATFGEFCNVNRRISHILTFYGFVSYVIATVVMVFAYPADPDTPAVWPALWNIGAIMVLIGGYWFFFFLRVNVVHDGQPWWRLVRADLFIVSLLASVTFALAFELAAMSGSRAATVGFFWLYILFTTLLFVSVPWSKFAHMFYKPVMAFQRRTEEADGSTSLPAGASRHHQRT